MKKSLILAIIVLLLGVLIFQFIDMFSKEENVFHSTWLWNSSMLSDENQVDDIIEFLKKEKIKVVYLQVDRKFDAKYYRKFIALCYDIDVEVHALTGSPKAVFYKEDDYLKKFFEYVSNYNNQVEDNEKFRGLHLDVEPYLLENWKVDQDKIVEAYQDYILYVIEESNKLDLLLNIDIPFWFDKVEYDNKYGTGILAEWIMNNVKNITIMAYRDNAAAILDIIEKELIWAEQYGNLVYIAIEVTDQEEKNVSFYGKEKEYLQEEMTKIIKEHKDLEIFIAVHDIKALMKMVSLEKK